MAEVPVERPSEVRGCQSRTQCVVDGPRCRGCSCAAAHFVRQAMAWWWKARRGERRFWRPRLESRCARPAPARGGPLQSWPSRSHRHHSRLPLPSLLLLAWPAVSTLLCKVWIAGGADCGSPIHQGTRLENMRLLTSQANSCWHRDSACSRCHVSRSPRYSSPHWYAVRNTTNATI